MAKWADFLISAVHYTETQNDRYISHLHVHIDNGDSVGSCTTNTKQEVIDAIDNGYTFVTIFKNKDDKWNKGEDVRKVKSGSYYYLRTDSNNIAEDNLENLPEF